MVYTYYLGQLACDLLAPINTLKYLVNGVLTPGF